MVFEIGGENHARKLGRLRSLHPGKGVRVNRRAGLRSDLSGDGGIFFGSGENEGKSRQKIGFELPGGGGEPAVTGTHEPVPAAPRRIDHASTDSMLCRSRIVVSQQPLNWSIYGAHQKCSTTPKS